jgi:hypothetical protein
VRPACFALLFALLAVAACAAPPPPPGPAAWYDAVADVIHYDPAWMAQTAAWYGQPGVDWIVAHEEGHRTVAHLLRDQGVNVEDMMPGPTVMVRLEQAAQCEASASGAHQPWTWGPAAVAAGYWDCPPAYVALVRAA